MAISATHAKLFRSLPLPRGGSLLEIGEANWYGDIEPDFPFDDSPDKTLRLFNIAKGFYAATFCPSRIVSIDMNGTPSALRYDLNEPLPYRHDDNNEQCLGYKRPLISDGFIGFLCTCPERPIDGHFDVVINHGTAEHVFNIAQVFRTMHERCADGGLMIHDAPFTGWIDHGFYCLQPTLFYDLAAANGYEMVLLAMHSRSEKTLSFDDRDSVYQLSVDGKIPDNAMLFVAMRKTCDEPFRIPHQGYYAETLSEAGKEAWRKNR